MAVKRSESQYVNEISDLKRQLSYFHQGYETLKELNEK